MKKLAKLSTVFIALSMSMASFAGVGETSGSTTCYVFKDDSLLKKSTCDYEGTIGSSMSYSFNQSGYTIAGLGSMRTTINHDMDGYGHSRGSVATLNDQKAINQSRDMNTLKVVSDSFSRAEENHDKVIFCYKSKQSPWELCIKE